MRILHTSDWHLGRSLEQNSLYEAHRLYIEHLVKVVNEHKVDALLISGDVYDRALPNAETVELLDWALAQLVPQTKVVVTSGNHDSAQRLGFGSRFMETAGVYLRTSIEDIQRPCVLGEGDDQVAIYGVPYLEPALSIRALRKIANAEDDTSPANHDSVMRLATKLIHQHADEHGYKKRVIMAHAWFAGAEASESERPIAVGGLENIPLNVLDGFTYAALGHIHKPTDPAPNIRYCGSPIKFSFSEVNHTKRSLLVDFSGADIQVEEIPTPVWREMADIKGTLEDLLENPEFAQYESHWVRVELLVNEIPAHAMDRLRTRFPHVIKLKLPTVGQREGAAIDINTISPEDFCCEFLDFTRGDTRPVTDWERAQIALAIKSAGAPSEAVVVGEEQD